MVVISLRTYSSIGRVRTITPLPTNVHETRMFKSTFLKDSLCEDKYTYTVVNGSRPWFGEKLKRSVSGIWTPSFRRTGIASCNALRASSENKGGSCAAASKERVTLGKICTAEARRPADRIPKKSSAARTTWTKFFVTGEAKISR